MKRALIVLILVMMSAPASAQNNVRAQLNMLQQEPNVRQVQEAALRYFNVNAETVKSMRSRAGLKALLPTLEIGGGYENIDADEDTVNKEFSSTEAWVLRAGGGKKWEIRGKATWNLPQLVFNAEQLDVASLAGLMEGLLKESTRLYFMRRRLQVDMILTPPTDQASLLSKQLRLEELTGLLDAMTGGWFGQELQRRTQQGTMDKKMPTGMPLDLSKHAPAGPMPKVLQPARMPTPPVLGVTEGVAPKNTLLKRRR